MPEELTSRTRAEPLPAAPPRLRPTSAPLPLLKSCSCGSGCTCGCQSGAPCGCGGSCC